MSIRVRRKKHPAITANSTLAAPSFGASADLFRGSFIPLIDGANVVNYDYISTLPSGQYVAATPMGTTQQDLAINPGSENCWGSVESSGGVYGDDCLAFNCNEYQVTFDYLTDNRKVYCTGHPFQVNDVVKFNSKQFSALPTISSGTFNLGKDDNLSSYIVSAIGTDWFEITDYLSNPITFTSNGAGSPEEYGVTTTGLPGMFFIRRQTTGGNHTAPNAPQVMLAPYTGRPYNTMEFWVKFPTGFRDYSSQNRNESSTRNFVLGTYHVRDTAVAPNTDEESNWHHYHKYHIEHWQNNNTWFRIRMNGVTNNQRNLGGGQTLDPHGPMYPLTFFDCMTRVYIRFYDYYRHPGVYGTYKAHMDRLRFYWRDRTRNITMTWDTYDPTAEPNVTANFPASIPNTYIDTTADTVRVNSHNLQVNDIIQFTTDGTLPTGLSPSTNYYVVEVVASNTVKISTSLGGGAFDFTDQGTGPHYVWHTSVSTPTNQDYGFTITNNTGGNVTGRIWSIAPSLSSSNPTPCGVLNSSAVEIEGLSTGLDISNEITLTPGANTFTYRVQPEWYRATGNYNVTAGGVSFIASDQFTDTVGLDQPSIQDANVVRVNEPWGGPPDGLDVWGIPFWATFVL